MEGPHIPPLEDEGRLMEEERGKNWEQEEGGMKASSPTGSTTDEETDEDSEPESPRVIRRKVSFADAFGLNLVSVKEFDNAEAAEPDVSLPPENEATHPLEDFYMSCLFTVPSSPEELDQRLQEQMLELESISLLPGTTTLRGIVRVVNLCYNKSVYARLTLDRWTSFFDLLAEYLPGSSDRKTDRFTFTYTLVPPFERGGTRVEVCLRYETEVGTFWANNKDMNYVLFCHQKGQGKENGPQVLEEVISYRSKRSCLKANRRGSAEEKTRETSNPSAAAAEAEATPKAEEAHRKDSADIQSLLHHEEHKPLVEIIKSRHRAARLTRVQDYLSQRGHRVPAAYAHDSSQVSRPSPATWRDSAGFLHKRQKKQSDESPQVLTYHQIPLLTLDWNNEKAHQWGSADVDDVWTGSAKLTSAKASEENAEESVNDSWEIFRNGTDDTDDTETSVCDAWQAFLNGPSCTNHSAVPESEWLQTAASVSPSTDKEPNVQYAASSKEQEFQVGTSLHAHTSALCQLLSDTCQISLATVALNSEDQPAEACVSSPGDDNPAMQDTSQRSQTNSVTGTRQEFCLEGATLVSEGYVDSSTECHGNAIREREREGIIGRAAGIGRGEPFTPHAAALVTSSGESETTDMTATPQSQNATAVDRISQGAGPGEGLSCSREEEVTGTAHNAMDDTMAFRRTIREGTKDREGIVFSTSRHGVEEGIRNSRAGNKVATDEEIFRPQKTDECEISQRYADEKQHEEFRLNRNSENPLQENESHGNETRLVQTNADEANLSQTSEGYFEQNHIIANESESEDVASNNKDLEGSKKTEVEPSHCTTSEEMTAEGIMVLNEEHDDKALQPNSSWQRGNTSINLEARNKQLWSIKAVEEERDSTLNQIQENVLKSKTDVLDSNQTEKGKGYTFPTHKCNENHSQDDMKGQREDVGFKIRAGDVKAKENDTSTELKPQRETLERTEEVMSQGDTDERMSIGKLEIEVLGESGGNAENPRGERKNAPAELKEQELTTEVKSSLRVEYERLSEGTKYPFTAENTGALEVMDSGLEEMFIERFGEDLVRGVWEEVFGGREQASNRDIDGIGGKLVDISDITQDCHLFETDSSDAFDSGVFSLTELPTDPNSSLFEGQTLASTSNECSPTETSHSLPTAEQTQFPSDPHTDLNSSAHPSQDLTPILAAPTRQSLTETAQSSPKENYNQTKERPATRQETGGLIQDCVVAHRESFYRSAHPPHTHPTSSSDELKEPDRVVLWSMLYILSQITRLLICVIFVAGFFFLVFLYDFPAFFALYVFSLSWWFYKWKRHRVAVDKGVVG